MSIPPRARLAAAVAVSAGFVLLGYLVAARPGEHLGYDSTFYVAMINGQGADVPGPFKFRLLVPFLASLLPLSPPQSLLLITYVSLFGTYFVVIRTCEAIGLSLRESAFGLLAIWGSTWHLYHYWNPYMTDAFALLALSVMALALVREQFWPFAAAAIIGCFGRETTLFLTPAWLATRHVTQAVALMIATGFALLIPRYFLASDGDFSMISAFNGSGTLFLPLIFIRQLHTIWGAVWFTGVAGLWCLPRPYSRRLSIAFAALFAGAFIASMVATDTGRMFGFLAPVLAIGSAQLYAVVRRSDSALAWMLVALIAVQGVFNTPDVMFDASAWLAGWPRRLFVAVELTLVAVIAYRGTQLGKRGLSPFSRGI